MSQTAYASLIKAFLALSAPDEPAVTEDPGALQMTVDGHTCTVFPAAADGRLVLQAPVLELAELDPASLGAANRFLHGLNWASAVGTGIMAMIDDEDRVLVCSVHEIVTLDAPQLSERMAELLDAAAVLKGVLKDLNGQAASSPTSLSAFGTGRGPAGDIQLV